MRLLIVGSLGGEIGTAGKIALERGAKVAHAGDIETALEALRSGQGADLLMVDVKLDIARLIGCLASERISVPVVACGVNTDADTAVKAIRAGAREFIPLPPQAELIAAVIEAVAEENHTIIYRDPAIAKVLRLAEQIAPSEASVLITGESGAGKELVARFVHRNSRRAKQPMVSVNCAAIPENLLESELFGHEKGAFTGAVARRIGKFEEASGGTLLLDEISEMDTRLQAKLLRALQEREIDRVGGTLPIKVDIRCLATTNRDIQTDVANGRFREDLFFRLNVVTLELPPLRARPADIPLLSEHFIKKYSEANDLPERRLSTDARDILMRHHWRGNVRELENTIHRAVLLASGDEIGPEVITLSSGAPEPANAGGGEHGGQSAPRATSSLVGRTVADVERDLILETLTHCLGNRTHTANILGISIRTLRNKLKQYAGDGARVPHPGETQRAAL
ncbi:MAG: sigma-54-dependent transcriptional regulator [Alphaproteobacteria bacterium]